MKEASLKTNQLHGSNHVTWWKEKKLWNYKNRQHISECQTPRLQRGHGEHFGSDGNSLYCDYKGGYMTVIFVKIHIMGHRRLILSLINYNATNLTSKEKKKICDSETWIPGQTPLFTWLREEWWMCPIPIISELLWKKNLLNPENNKEVYRNMGFPSGSAVKHPPVYAGDLGWKIPWRRKWQPIPVLGNPTDREA